MTDAATSMLKGDQDEQKKELLTTFGLLEWVGFTVILFVLNDYLLPFEKRGL